MDALAALLAIAFFSGIGAYFGSHLRRKGQRFATQEDVSGLAAQQSEMRSALQRIEHEGWIVQKRWELKRQALFHLMNTIGEYSVLQAQRGSATAGAVETRLLELSEQLFSGVAICRAVLDEGRAAEFDAILGPLDVAATPSDSERAAAAGQVLRDLEPFVRQELTLQAT